MVQDMDFKAELKHRTEFVDKILESYLPKAEGHQKTIMEAMQYSVMAGGKRIRPILMLETFRLLGGEQTELVEPFMAAMEMIHTYSLVHDDLPAMDNDEYRRGHKTTHVVFGHAMGILAGDALLNYAFETACRAFEKEETLTLAAKAMKVLSTKAGIYGMVGGQVVDVENCNCALKQEQLDFIYRLKTGALIEASMMIGAIMAGADEMQIAQIEKIAQDIGLAFQIQDDILDVIGSFEEIGKPVNSDEKNKKTTYVTIKGLETAKKDVGIISERAISGMQNFEGKNEFLQQLVIYLIDRKK